ncbi:MAG: phosphate ABC transporter substrate-binding protein PstS [Solirubrobacteraceae bacterium]
MAFVALGASATGVTASAMAAQLKGAGSTLVAPLESEWAGAFATATGNTVQYSAVGSGSGITDIQNRLVDFGASDAPLTSTQASACTDQAPGTCLTIPWALSATGIGYNIPGIGSGLKLSGNVLAGIYAGLITNWSNSAIAKLNKGVHLPHLTISPIFRSGGSGDTYAFTNFLSAVNSSWAHKYGFATTISFPAGTAATGNSGVASRVKTTPGAIGYISGSYLISAEITTAKVENAAGRFEYPNPNSIQNAAATVHSVPAAGLSIVNPPKSQKIAYPISTFTYAIVPQSPPASTVQLLKSWLTFCVTTGRAYGFTLDFVAIPKVVETAALADIAKLS